MNPQICGLELRPAALLANKTCQRRRVHVGFTRKGIPVHACPSCDAASAFPSVSKGPA